MTKLETVKTKLDDLSTLLIGIYEETRKCDDGYLDQIKKAKNDNDVTRLLVLTGFLLAKLHQEDLIENWMLDLWHTIREEIHEANDNNKEYLNQRKLS